MKIEEWLMGEDVSIEKVIVESVGYENCHKFLPMCDDRFIFKNVLIHIDFKGAPPRFDFLMKFIKFFA